MVYAPSKMHFPNHYLLKLIAHSLKKYPSKMNMVFIANCKMNYYASSGNNNINNIKKGVVAMNRTPLDRLALVLVIIGALNWLLVGIAGYDLVTAIFGGNLFSGTISLFSRVIFALVGISGLYAISLLFRENPANARE
jgi:uncharacterized protein